MMINLSVMDDEAITWNLKGPKRMKKRRELNALIKNNLKYKPFLQRQNSSTNDLKLANRLLKNPNDSTSEDNDDYYFAANKLTIRNRNRRSFCKIVQLIVVGFLVTFGILTGIILLFSYSRFNETIIDLKNEINKQNEQNMKKLDELKSKVNEMDAFNKSLSEMESRVNGIEKSLNDSLINSNNNNRNLRRNRDRRSTDQLCLDPQKFIELTEMNMKIMRSLKHIYLSNRLNSYMIEWLFNRSELMASNNNNNKNTHSDDDELNESKDLFRMMFKKYNNRHHKQSATTDFKEFTRLINQHLKVDRLADSDSVSFDVSRLDEQTLADLFADFHKYMSFDLLNQVNATLIEPLLHKLHSNNGA